MSRRIPAPVDQSRRSFLRAFGVGTSCAAAALAGCEVAEIRQDGAVGSLDFDVTTYPALATVGGMVAADAGLSKLLLIRVSDTEVAALNRVCTHAACEMIPDAIGKWDAAAKQLTCLCHDSTFDATGKYLTGPGGVADLPSYPVTFDAATGTGTVDLGGA